MTTPLLLGVVVVTAELAVMTWMTSLIQANNTSKLCLAADLSNLEVSMAFASPQLLPHVADLLNCPVMDDMPNDMWAFGVALHKWLTCACGNYQWAFGPHLDPDVILPPEQQQADVASKQESWVCCCLVWLVLLPRSMIPPRRAVMWVLFWTLVGDCLCFWATWF